MHLRQILVHKVQRDRVHFSNKRVQQLNQVASHLVGENWTYRMNREFPRRNDDADLANEAPICDGRIEIAMRNRFVANFNYLIMNRSEFRRDNVVTQPNSFALLEWP